MKFLKMDGVTAVVMRDAALAKNLTLEDYGAMLLDAAAGCYEHISSTPYAQVDFTTKYQRAGINQFVLYRPGTDDFSSALDREEVKGLPPVWGGILRKGDRCELILAGIELSYNAAILLEDTPKIMILGVDLPDSVKSACAGRMISEVIDVSIPSLGGLVIASVRDAGEEDLDKFSNNGRYAMLWKTVEEKGIVFEVEKLPDEILKIT